MGFNNQKNETFLECNMDKTDMFFYLYSAPENNTLKHSKVNESYVIEFIKQPVPTRRTKTQHTVMYETLRYVRFPGVGDPARTEALNSHLTVYAAVEHLTRAWSTYSKSAVSLTRRPGASSHVSICAVACEVKTGGNSVAYAHGV